MTRRNTLHSNEEPAAQSAAQSRSAAAAYSGQPRPEDRDEAPGAGGGREGGDDPALSLEPEVLQQHVAAEEQRREILREFIARNLKSGTDFGTITTGERESKPCLFKPGAEKICLLFQLRARFVADVETLAMAGHPPGLFAYLCRLSDQRGRVVGEGRGAAELTERDGWTINNAIKTCEKRAQVDAVLRVAGLSEIFTQDLEDTTQRRAMEREGGPRRPVGHGGSTPLVAEPAAAYPPPVERAAPPPVERAAPAAHVTAPEPPAAAAAGEEPCSEQQQRAIRALLPRAGLTEDDMLAKMGVAVLPDLTRAKASRVIDRLTASARERGARSAG